MRQVLDPGLPPGLYRVKLTHADDKSHSVLFICIYSNVSVFNNKKQKHFIITERNLVLPEGITLHTIFFYTYSICTVLQNNTYAKCSIGHSGAGKTAA